MFDKEALLRFISAHTEDEIRKMLCDWLGCREVLPCPEEQDPASKPSIPTPLTVVSLQAYGDEMSPELTLTGPKDSVPTQMLLDTGSFEVLLPQALADTLGLPNLGALQIQGVTGASEAYKSEVTITLPGGHVFEKIACVVDPSFTSSPPLLGINFWEQAGLSFWLNPQAMWLKVFSIG